MHRTQIQAVLRKEFTDREYRELVKQIQGFIDAIDTMRSRTPDVAHELCASIGLVETNGMSTRTRDALAAIVAKLRTAPAAPPSPIPSRQALRLAFRSD
jgi:hypothetical protein